MAEREEDLYAQLGVSRSADADTIKKSYRKLAMKYHPDKNPGDKKSEERFKKINFANDVLSDPKKRALYDEFGEMGLREGFDATRAREYMQWQSQGGAGPNLNDLFGRTEGPVDFDSIFSRFFGGQAGGAAGARGSPGGRRRGSVPFGMGFDGPMRGSDLESEITVDFVQAVLGGEMRLSVHGEPLTVRIPPGAMEGSRVRIAGRGMPGPGGGPRGDLLLEIHVREHDSYWLEGRDLHVELPVTVGEAYRGAKVPMPTPSGEIAVKIPAHTRSGAMLRLRGKGVPATKSKPASDLIVHVLVMLPEVENADVEGAVDTMEKAYSTNVREKLRF